MMEEPVAVRPARNSGRAPVRLLEYAPGRLAAFAPGATVALAPRGEVVAVPGTPAHALGLMPWGWGHIPLLDLALLLGEAAPPLAGGEHALVLAWQPAPGRPALHGALRAPWLLRLAEVADEQQCDDAAWHGRAACCFRHEGQVVPLLEPRLLFGARPGG